MKEIWEREPEEFVGKLDGSQAAVELQDDPTFFLFDEYASRREKVRDFGGTERELRRVSLRAGRRCNCSGGASGARVHMNIIIGPIIGVGFTL